MLPSSTGPAPEPPDPRPARDLAAGCCPHGNAESDCLPCQKILRQSAAIAAASSAKCADHGLKAGRRPDGQAQCPLCRRMEVINAHEPARALTTR
jgi:hypothetical protein